MREVRIGSQNFTKVLCLDEPGQDGACHIYEIVDSESVGSGSSFYCKVNFQNGPVKEFGKNGCHQEDLLAIVLDRLQSFQGGDYRCRENDLAITKIEEAMHWLNHRTNARIARGVEGTSVK